MIDYQDVFEKAKERLRQSLEAEKKNPRYENPSLNYHDLLFGRIEGIEHAIKVLEAIERASQLQARDDGENNE